LARDLREKKQIEESLLFDRHLMQTLLDHIPDITLWTSLTPSKSRQTISK
jgi:hypothetical protein